MPELYAASLMDEAKPVGKPAEPKTRKPRQKKVKEEEEADDAPNPAPITPPAEKLVDIPMKKDKKPPTEKQLAAREKARQTRMAKVLKMATDKANAEKVAEEKEVAKLAKKEVAAEKRRLAREAKAAGAGKDGAVASVEIGEKKTKKRKEIDPDAPPAWMHHLISGIKSELGTDKPKKVLKSESQQEATEKWSDPLVRARIQDVQNNVMNKMSSGIFPGRKL